MTVLIENACEPGPLLPVEVGRRRRLHLEAVDVMVEDNLRNADSVIRGRIGPRRSERDRAEQRDAKNDHVTHWEDTRTQRAATPPRQITNLAIP